MGIFPNFRGENKKCLSCHHLERVPPPTETGLIKALFTNHCLLALGRTVQGGPQKETAKSVELLWQALKMWKFKPQP